MIFASELQNFVFSFMLFLLLHYRDTVHFF